MSNEDISTSNLYFSPSNYCGKKHFSQETWSGRNKLKVTKISRYADPERRRWCHFLWSVRILDEKNTIMLSSPLLCTVDCFKRSPSRFL